MTDAGVPGVARLIPRAQRFSLQLPVLYRRSDESPWLQGTTRNISRSGVLFQTHAYQGSGVSLDLLLLMPEDMVGPVPAKVHCHGRVVRILSADAPTTDTTLAVKISDYRFVPVQAVE